MKDNLEEKIVSMEMFGGINNSGKKGQQKNQTYLCWPLLCCLFFTSCSVSQTPDFVQGVMEDYEEFKEPALKTRRFTHQDIQPLIDKFRKDPRFRVEKVGESIEGRELSLISIGSGETSVFLWSQMHGDESTATMASFDILNFLASEALEKEKQDLLSEVTLHFLPMLNPDGAERFQRRNVLGIDVNRDALRLQSPEGRTLKRIRDSLEADWGFNLHDQSKYYNASGTAKPATISFLAPAFDFEKSVNEKRGDAMKLIVVMNEELQKQIPGQVGRYNDDFEPRAFGDNIQKWGTRTILIESGGHPGDPEKQEIRRMNVLAILSAILSISNESYSDINTSAYSEIPHNDRKLFDLKLEGLNYELLGETYLLDLGINHVEVAANKEAGFYYRGVIADQGDLSTNFAYETFDATGYDWKQGKIYPKVLQGMEEVAKLDFPNILSEGYSYVRVKELPEKVDFSDYPVQIVAEGFKIPSGLWVGMNPSFFLEKNGKLEYIVINGFLQELGMSMDGIENSLILN